MFGSVTRQNICQPLAPRLTAASSSSGPTASITGISSRATNGKVTKAVARIRPGVAKITSKLGSRSPEEDSVSQRGKGCQRGDGENQAEAVVASAAERRPRQHQDADGEDGDYDSLAVVAQ